MRDRPSRAGRPRARLRPGTPAGREGGARPAGRRAGAGSAGQTTRTSAPRPPGRFTGRAVVLGMVLLALVLSYVYPVRTYLTQQAEISALRGQQQVQRERIAELEALAAKWRDDDYVRIQARRRLFMVRPGESLLIVESPDMRAGGGTRTGAAPSRPWYDTLWASIRTANDPSGADDPGDATQGEEAD